MNEAIRNLARDYLKKMPGHRATIIDLAELANDEVDSGESLDNELYLMSSDLDEILSQEAK